LYVISLIDQVPRKGAKKEQRKIKSGRGQKNGMGTPC